MKKTICALTAAALMLVALPLMAADEGKLVYENGFENPAKDKVWRPRSAGVKTSIVEKEGHPGKCMLVEGTETKGWNYAQGANRSIKVTPGTHYRYEVSLLVEDLKAPQPPFFKFQLVAAEKGATVKNNQPRTKPYNQLTGGWQTLSKEFVCPEGAGTAWFAIEKGGKVDATVKCWVDDVRLYELPAK